MTIRKKVMLCPLLAMLCLQAVAQPKPVKKPATGKSNSTQAEIDKLMQEAMKDDGLTPEKREEMKKMLNGSQSGTKDKFASTNSSTDFTSEAGLPPKKDPVRIAAVNKKPLSDAELKTFITTTRTLVENKLTSTYTIPGKRIYDSLKREHPTDNSVALLANGLWLSGNPEMAVYFMGKSCEDRPSDADNLNNYAAFLTMLGGEQYSLPVLYTLNSKYPKNSTILNNIGQAWFGLGDMDLAMRYLDSAIRIYPGHSQAHYTESVIEDSKGHTDAATEHLLKSLKQAYSEDKVNKLSKHGRKLKASDISWKQPKPQDGLGLSRYNLPPFPKNTTEVLKMKPGLDQFYEDIRDELQELNEKAGKHDQEEAEKEAGAANSKDPSKIMDYYFGKLNHGPLYAKAMFLYNDYYSDIALGREYERLLTDLTNTLQENAQARSELSGVLGKAGGVGFDTDESIAICNKINSEYLMKTNSKLEDKYSKYLNFQRVRQNTLAYYMGFIAPPEDAEAVHDGYKAGFLQDLIEFECEDEVECPAVVPEDSVISGKLLDYDSLRNDTLAYFKLFKFFEMRVMANRTYTKWDFSVPLPWGKIGVKGEMTQNDDKEGIFGAGRISKATLEFGASVSAGKVEAGPAKAEAKVEGGGFIEGNEDEYITDIGIKAEAGVKAGALGQKATIIGAETKMGWNSGIHGGFKSFLLK